MNILRGLVFLNVPNMYGSMKCSVKGRQSYNSLLQIICFYHIKMTFFGEECGRYLIFSTKFLALSHRLQLRFLKTNVCHSVRSDIITFTIIKSSAYREKPIYYHACTIGSSKKMFSTKATFTFVYIRGSYGKFLAWHHNSTIR